MSTCPCGSDKEYTNCCERFHTNKEQAPSAELLMRARYSAFAKNQIDYIESTHIPGTEDFSAEEAKKWASESNWDKLEIVNTKNGQKEDSSGVVEFKAFYSDKDQKNYIHHEISNFKKIDGKWFYEDGQIVGTGPLKRSEPKIGRNDPCLCGSEKKFKKCCGV